MGKTRAILGNEEVLQSLLGVVLSIFLAMVCIEIIGFFFGVLVIELCYSHCSGNSGKAICYLVVYLGRKKTVG